ncbi:MAG: hypothetical protein R3E98_12075 [Gemmatimonadota bacterium]
MKARASVWGVLLAGSALWGVAVACSDSSVEVGGGELAITLTVTPQSVEVGDTVFITTEAVGTSLAGTIIDYGNGRLDSLNAFGAQTQDNRIRDHFYSAAGTYTIRATVVDLSQGTRSAEATVQVSDP